MKKKSVLILTAVLLLIMACSPAVFATASSDGLNLVESTPADGYKRVQAQNVMIKLYFDDSVSAADTRKANKDKFKFTDSKGNKVDYKIYYDEKDPKKICLLASSDLETEKSYTVSISGDLVNDDGEILGADKTVDFETKKAGGGLVYAILMLAMIVVMMVVTVREQRKAAESEETASEMTMNPYKLAKEKGISVEEANRLISREREKQRKKQEKRQQKEAKLAIPAETDEPEVDSVFRVHTKRVVKRK